MELADYLRVIRNHPWGVIAIALATTAVALAWSFSQPKVYAADATGFVSIDSGAGGNAALASVGDTLAKSRATSYVDVATSRPVAEDVIEALGLDTTPSALIGNISVSQPTDTVLIKITAKENSPEEAQALADAWVQALSTEVAKLENPKADETAQVPSVKVFASAALPTSPVSPNPERDGALGLVVGLLLGFGYALIRSQVDRRLRSAEDIEKKFQVSVIGAIPVEKNLETGSDGALSFRPHDGPLGGAYSTHRSDEAFRKLRTNLSYMDIDNPPRIILVTSSLPGDGKSTVSANLAVAIAASGQPVMLIDADLRRPIVARLMGLVEGAGLTDVLVGRAEIDDVLQEHADVPGLQVMAAGAIPPNPSELLASRTMRDLLRQLSERWLIIVDAPPLLPVTDAAILSTACDGTIVVAGFGKTLDTELAEALANVRSVNGKVLGVVFNRVPRRLAPSRYYGSSYGYVGEAPSLPAQEAVMTGKHYEGKRAKPADRPG
ncbi:MAG: polysaccharide biosynthesis tyrosine autokinase [Nocardioides sp.]|uniref:polysaccharide biosynthesis tyrosine autokinase n=1 Tax=Nocardioides sp. TaxID=35761 RepID=UPI0039E33155